MTQPIRKVVDISIDKRSIDHQQVRDAKSALKENMTNVDAAQNASRSFSRPMIDDDVEDLWDNVPV